MIFITSSQIFAIALLYICEKNIAKYSHLKTKLSLLIQIVVCFLEVHTDVPFQVINKIEIKI